jgi:hypothetical protein
MSRRAPILAGGGRALALSRTLALRLAVHLAAWAPFVFGMVEAVRTGWRPVGDSAAIALRSWDSLTAHGPLVGQATQLAHAVHDPGPLEYWLLAIPVHLDPRYGAVWGAALWCMVAASLAIEAAWSALGGLGGLIAAGFILGIVEWQPLIALQPIWNPWFGVMFFLAALAASWAALSGNRWWWVVLVVAGSVASQAHLMFALASVALVLVTLAVGLADSLRARAGYRWAIAGVLAGLACWTGPFIQQLTGRPGNLSALLNGQGTGPLSGLAFGLKTLTAAIEPPPLWWTASSRLHGLLAAHLITGRSAGFAVAALILLAAVLVVAVRPLRSRRLAALAAVSLVASVTTLATYSRIPVTNLKLITLDYLDITMFPLGVLAWLTVGSAVVLAGRRVIGRRRPTGAAPGTEGSGRGQAAGTLPDWAAQAATFAAVVLIALASLLAVAQQAPAPKDQLAGVIRLASQRIERVLPGQPIALFVADRQVHDRRRLTLGLVWALRASGYRALVGSYAARELAPMYVFRGQQVPQVTVRVSGSNVSVNVTSS